METLGENLFPHIFFFFLKFLAIPPGMWDPSSLTRDQTDVPCIGSTESSPLGHLTFSSYQRLPTSLQQSCLPLVMGLAGPTWIIQDNLPISRSLNFVISAMSHLPCRVTYRTFQGSGCGHLWGLLFCLVVCCLVTQLCPALETPGL